MTGITIENKKERIHIDLQLNSGEYFGDAQTEILSPNHISAYCNFSNGMQSVTLEATANFYNMLLWRIEEDHPFKDNAQYIGSKIEEQLIMKGLIAVNNYTIRLNWLDNRAGNFVRDNISINSNEVPTSFIGLCRIEKNSIGEHFGHLRLKYSLHPTDNLYYHYDGNLAHTTLYSIIISHNLLSGIEGTKIGDIIFE